MQYFLHVSDAELRVQAEELANFTGKLNITQDVPKNGLTYLQLDKSGLAIVSPEFKPIYVADIYAKLKHRLKNINQDLLIQAIKIKSSNSPITVWDLTAGLGRDAILMANFGYQVTMVEKNSLLATILYYVVQNECVPKCKNLNVIYADSLGFLAKEHKNKPNVIYLDPMFQDKKSAKAKKEMQIIEFLATDAENFPDLETAKLFELASELAQNKIVVKRDNKQQNIVKSPLPSYSKSGKTVRYDAYNIL